MHSHTLAVVHPSYSLRRAKAAFRFDKGRDDHDLRGETARVFTTQSPLLREKDDVGVYGAPVAALVGYTLDTEGGTHSVIPGSGYILGRVVEVTLAELARLDQVAERGGAYHRFLATVKGPPTGHEFSVWVFQKIEHAGSVELSTSAEALTEAPKQLLAA